MHKVVVERPRKDRHWAKSRPRPKPPFDDLPHHESIKARHIHRKHFSDLLGPLKRWLRSQVGRPWNDIYSEACAVIKPDSIVRAHIKGHMLQYVQRHTFMHGGKVCVIDQDYLRLGMIPVEERQHCSNLFFVHPDTGLLCAVAQPPSKHLEIPRPRKQPETLRWLNECFALKQIKGLWFECQFRHVPPKGQLRVYDHALGKHVLRKKLHWRDGQQLHCFAKRQLSRRQLRHFGLRNSPIASSIGAQSSVRSFGFGLRTALQ
ncbi:MAG: hypothetical protein FJ404_05580 [Verrucomicrobia bacterium]|nr:hypothetical protein [Verrucomicrobiota bacterium]